MLKKSIVVENLYNLQLMFLTVGIIEPIWENGFDEIVTDDFRSMKKKESKKIKYMKSFSKTYGYYQNHFFTILEIQCKNNQIVMGIIKKTPLTGLDTYNKYEGLERLNESTILHLISQLSNTVIDTVMIPMFEQNIKLRFNNCLKKMGLQSVFIKIFSHDLFPEHVVLQDVVQNIKITIHNNYNNYSKSYKKSHISNKTFIANEPFIYYFRIPANNSIILIGYFNSL